MTEYLNIIFLDIALFLAIFLDLCFIVYPTINTVITFDVKLPIDSKFMPELQCEVYDHMLSGMHNSLLGVFSIDVKKIIRRTSKQIIEDINGTRKELGVSTTSEMLMKQINDTLAGSFSLNQ